jgi:hypothetical protein
MGGTVSVFLQMIDAAITNLGADMAFGAIVLVSFGLLLLALLFFLLLVRAIWRYLVRRTWGDVIASSERKALR